MQQLRPIFWRSTHKHGLKCGEIHKTHFYTSLFNKKRPETSFRNLNPLESVVLDYVNHNATLAKSDFIRLFREALLCAPHSNNVLEQTGVGGLLKTEAEITPHPGRSAGRGEHLGLLIVLTHFPFAVPSITQKKLNSWNVAFWKRESKLKNKSS